MIPYVYPFRNIKPSQHQCCPVLLHSDTHYAGVMIPYVYPFRNFNPSQHQCCPVPPHSDTRDVGVMIPYVHRFKILNHQTPMLYCSTTRRYSLYWRHEPLRLPLYNIKRSQHHCCSFPPLGDTHYAGVMIPHVYPFRMLNHQTPVWSCATIRRYSLCRCHDPLSLPL